MKKALAVRQNNWRLLVWMPPQALQTFVTPLARTLAWALRVFVTLFAWASPQVFSAPLAQVSPCCGCSRPHLLKHRCECHGHLRPHSHKRCGHSQPQLRKHTTPLVQAMDFHARKSACTWIHPSTKTSLFSLSPLIWAANRKRLGNSDLEDKKISLIFKKFLHQLTFLMQGRNAIDMQNSI